MCYTRASRIVPWGVQSIDADDHVAADTILWRSSTSSSSKRMKESMQNRFSQRVQNGSKNTVSRF